MNPDTLVPWFILFFLGDNLDEKCEQFSNSRSSASGLTKNLGSVVTSLEDTGCPSLLIRG